MKCINVAVCQEVMVPFWNMDYENRTIYLCLDCLCTVVEDEEE